MKQMCPFCKTEYETNVSGNLVQCVCCGCVWRTKKKKRFSFLWLMSLICFVFAISIFAAVVYIKSNVDVVDVQKPLIVNVTNIRNVLDAYGDAHFVISGTVHNQSGEIYGVPDLVIILRDENGNELARQKFLPPVPLLDVMESADFTHTFGRTVSGAQKVSVEFDED